MSKYNFKWICWIFPVKMQMQGNHLDFSFQNLIWKNIKSSLSNCHYYGVINSLLNASRLKKKPVKVDQVGFFCNLLTFSCQNTDSNEFIWFYLSKHKIKINFLDFMSESKFDWKKYEKQPVNVDKYLAHVIKQPNFRILNPQ